MILMPKRLRENEKNTKDGMAFIKFAIMVLTFLSYEATGWSSQRPRQQRPWSKRQNQKQHGTFALYRHLRSPKLIDGYPNRIRQSTSILRSSGDGDGRTEKSLPPGVVDGETLLRISLSVTPKDGDGGNEGDDGILDTLQSFLQSFPFAAVLPVQPLTYKPRRGDKSMGVDVVFLRKKTMEKGSEDGGISFYLDGGSDYDGDDDDDGDSVARRVDITAVRNAQGQCVSKVFSEGVIVKAFAKSFCKRVERGGANEEAVTGESGSSTIGSDKLRERVSVNSIYHKWM